MSRVSKKITDWLYIVLQPQYTHTEITYRDIYRFLLVYLERGFKIRTAVYTSALGGSDLLVNLYGPLSCASGVFQIEIWVPLNYPYVDSPEMATNMSANGVPVVYVVPLKGLIISPGNNVDSQGQVYHPFLVQWFTLMKLGQIVEQYNLILLMECLVSIFERSSPICLAPQSIGPAFPPKLNSSETVSPQHSGIGISTNGPPLPQKVLSLEGLPRLIPPKYRAPLPLPGQTSPVRWTPPDPSVPQSAPNQPCRAIPFTQNNGIDHNWPKVEPKGPAKTASHQEHIQSLNVSDRNHTPHNTKPRRKPPRDSNGADGSSIEDLMDQVTLEAKKETSNPFELQRIAHYINMHLDLKNPDCVNGLLPKINEMKSKASALYSQLMHHNTQAKANAENLDNHVLYLTKQVTMAGQMNQQLHDLSEKNRNSKDEVYLSTSGDRKIPLEELILPDLMLVRQLYDTVAEIGGYKDAIKLVGGSYKSEPEFINDENLDSCIRSVRALSRELFWLEVTKNEIGHVMGLQI